MECLRATANVSLWKRLMLTTPNPSRQSRLLVAIAIRVETNVQGPRGHSTRPVSRSCKRFVLLLTRRWGTQTPDTVTGLDAS